MALKAGRVGVKSDQVDPYGRINTGEQYVLPVASNDTLGGIKVGTGVSINSSGVLSADAQVPQHSSTEAGKLLSVDSNGDLEFVNSEIPAHSSAESGKILSVDSDGDLEFVNPPSSGGMKLYTKTFSLYNQPGYVASVRVNEPATGMGTYIYNNVSISGYTPVFVKCIDMYSGYPYVASIKADGSVFAYGSRGENTSSNDVRFLVYYVKDDECTITSLD